MIIIFWFLFFSYLLSILNAAAIVLDLKVQLVLNNFNGILMVFFVSFPSRLHCLLHTATKSIFLKYSFKKIILPNLSVAYNHLAIKGLASTITIISLWPICLSKLSSNTLIYHAHVSVQWASFLFWAHILHLRPPPMLLPLTLLYSDPFSSLFFFISPISKRFSTLRHARRILWLIFYRLLLLELISLTSNSYRILLCDTTQVAQICPFFLSFISIVVTTLLARSFLLYITAFEIRGLHFCLEPMSVQLIFA